MCQVVDVQLSRCLNSGRRLELLIDGGNEQKMKLIISLFILWSESEDILGDNNYTRNKRKKLIEKTFRDFFLLLLQQENKKLLKIQLSKTQMVSHKQSYLAVSPRKNYRWITVQVLVASFKKNNNKVSVEWEAFKLFKENIAIESCLFLLAPSVFLANLFFFSWSEVVLDVKGLADLIGSLPLDHVGDRLARDIEQTTNVQIVCGEN